MVRKASMPFHDIIRKLITVQQINQLSIASNLRRLLSENLFLPCTAKTLQGCAPWRDDSLLPPLMKAGRLGLLWSPTNFPGCCPIRAGCQATAGTLQAGISCSPSNSGPPGREGMGRGQEPLSLDQSVLSQSVGDAGHQCRSVLLQYVSVYSALMEHGCFRGQRKAFQSNLEGEMIENYFIKSNQYCTPRVMDLRAGKHLRTLQLHMHLSFIKMTFLPSGLLQD